MLVCEGTFPDQLIAGDLVCFDYGNPGENQISRCGVVINFVGAEKTRCLHMFDYSLAHGGADYRNYRLNLIRGLAIIKRVNDNVPPLQQFKSNLTGFADNILKNPA